VTVAKETKQLNDLERTFLIKMYDTKIFKKLAGELLVELIVNGEVKRTEEEINKICEQIYEELELAEEASNSRQKLN
jgi:hypothetical protein